MSENLKLPKDHSDRSDWWFTDSKGRKIGYMWPEDMLAIIDSIWGYRQGIKSFAVYAALSRTTVEKYCNGKIPIPKTIALLVTHMQELMIERGAHKKTMPWRSIPYITCEWLPERRQEPTFKVDRKPFG